MCIISETALKLFICNKDLTSFAILRVARSNIAKRALDSVQNAENIPRLLKCRRSGDILDI